MKQKSPLMVAIEQLRTLALSFPEATESAHFEKTSFRIRNKIFATYDEKHNRASIKLSPIDQSVYTAHDRKMIYAVPNKWGKDGWTNIDMEQVGKTIFTDVLKITYCEVAPKKLAKMVMPVSGNDGGTF